MCCGREKQRCFGPKVLPANVVYFIRNVALEARLVNVLREELLGESFSIRNPTVISHLQKGEGREMRTSSSFQAGSDSDCSILSLNGLALLMMGPKLLIVPHV